MRTKIAHTRVALFARWLIFSAVAAAAALIAAPESWAATTTITTSAKAVDGWRTVAPVGNLEGLPFSAVGLEWEAANVGWNSSLTFDDSSASGWHVPVPRDVSIFGGTSTNNIWADGGNDGSGSTPAYFRKTFVLNAQPAFAYFGSNIPNDFSNLADDDVQIYINGQLVYDDQSGVAEQIPVTNVTRFLHPGPNLIAAKVHDSFGGFEHFSLVLSITGNGPDVVRPESGDFPAELRDIKFGEAVAIRNGIAFIGIPKAADGGHVALLNLTASGWKRVGTIKLPEFVARNIGESEFGRVLTWRDGVLVVGGKKAAYYFSRRDGIWTFRDVLRPQFVSLGSDFPVALRYEGGDADIAGLPQLHGVGTLLATEFAASCCPSRVHIFHLVPTRQTFLYVGFVQPSDSRAGDNFGADLSMTSREFVVGSPRGSRSRIAGLPAYNQSGAAYIFRRGADGRWKQGQKMLPDEPAPGFGTSVAIDNDMIIIGAPKIDLEGPPAGTATVDGHTAGGAAYVFVPGVGRYVQARKLRPKPEQLFKYQDFGYRIAMFGSNVVVAAVRPYEADGLFPNGLAVAYTRDGTSLTTRGIAQGHVVAASMALANNWLLLGVPYERSCPSGCIGSANIYDLNALRSVSH